MQRRIRCEDSQVDKSENQTDETKSRKECSFSEKRLPRGLAEELAMEVQRLGPRDIHGELEASSLIKEIEKMKIHIENQLPARLDKKEEERNHEKLVNAQFDSLFKTTDKTIKELAAEICNFDRLVDDIKLSDKNHKAKCQNCNSCNCTRVKDNKIKARHAAILAKYQKKASQYFQSLLNYQTVIAKKAKLEPEDVFRIKDMGTEIMVMIKIITSLTDEMTNNQTFIDESVSKTYMDFELHLRKLLLLQKNIYIEAINTTDPSPDVPTLKNPDMEQRYDGCGRDCSMMVLVGDKTTSDDRIKYSPLSHGECQLNSCWFAYKKIVQRYEDLGKVNLSHHTDVVNKLKILFELKSELEGYLNIKCYQLNCSQGCGSNELKDMRQDLLHIHGRIKRATWKIIETSKEWSKFEVTRHTLSAIKNKETKKYHILMKDLKRLYYSLMPCLAGESSVALTELYNKACK